MYFDQLLLNYFVLRLNVRVLARWRLFLGLSLFPSLLLLWRMQPEGPFVCGLHRELKLFKGLIYDFSELSNF